MNKLEDLYNGMRSLQRAGVPLNDKLLQDISKCEESLIKSEILPALSKNVEPLLSQIQRELVLVLEYHPGEPISVALSRKAKISEIMEAKRLIPQGSIAPRPNRPVVSPTPALPVEQHFPSKKITNHTKGMRVTFPSGKVIWEQNAIDTFVMTLREIGFDRVNSVGIIHCGYNLASKTQRPTELGRIWQHECDGWYIYSNISNNTKVDDLKQISRRLGLRLQIDQIKPR